MAAWMLLKLALLHAAGPSPGLLSLSTYRVWTTAAAGATTVLNHSAPSSSPVKRRALIERNMGSTPSYAPRPVKRPVPPPDDRRGEEAPGYDSAVPWTDAGNG